MSAHHYFRDFYYCDSGIITWLLIWELLSKVKIPLSDLVSESKRRFPSSGEINFAVNDPENCMQALRSYLKQVLLRLVKPMVFQLHLKRGVLI